MKKCLLFLALILAPAGLFAAQRSSYTQTSDGLVRLTTCPTVIYSVIVANGVPWTDLTFYASPPTFTTNASTRSKVDTAVDGQKYDFGPYGKDVMGLEFVSGAWYVKTGTAAITIIWDFLRNAPAGQENRGVDKF